MSLLSERSPRPPAGRLLKAALLAGLGTLLAAPHSLVPPEQAAPSPQADRAPVARWSMAALDDLVRAVESARGEGLDPADYGATALRQARLAGGDDAEVTRLADATALALAHDFAGGRVRDRQRFGWHLENPPPSADALRQGLDRALAQQRVHAWLRGLLPDSPRYSALRAALSRTLPDDPGRVAILANLERWRWMPRDLAAERHLWVNVPSQLVSLVEDGLERASYVAVVGAPKTPTPALFAVARSVVANPSWSVPRSIIERGEVRPGRRAARQGFLFTTKGGELHARQQPGPQNALGRVKIDMPNRHAIYLHDTPAKAVFAAAQRARSHGCIRVQDIEGLAAQLAGDPSNIADALEGSQTRTVTLDRTWPVWIVYFTLDLDPERRLVRYPDIYGRDAMLAAALAGRPAPPEPVAIEQDVRELASVVAPRARQGAVSNRQSAEPALRPASADVAPHPGSAPAVVESIEEPESAPPPGESSGDQPGAEADADVRSEPSSPRPEPLSPAELL